MSYIHSTLRLHMHSIAKKTKRRNLKKLLTSLVLVFLTINLIEYNYLSRINQVKVLPPNECSVIRSNAVQFKIQINGIFYPKKVPLYENKSIDLECLNKNIKSIKTILMWNKFIGKPLTNQYEFGYSRPFEQLKCPVTSCLLTNDTSKLNDSSLVLFHLRNKIDKLPSHRPLNQRYVNKFTFIFKLRRGGCVISEWHTKKIRQIILKAQEFCD